MFYHEHDMQMVSQWWLLINITIKVNQKFVYHVTNVNKEEGYGKF